MRRRCDRRRDCTDGGDELNCPNPSTPICGPHHFQCGTGHCLELNRRCDDYPDCPDRSDEKDCSIFLFLLQYMYSNFTLCKKNLEPKTNKCSIHEFHCKIGGCISLHYKCDKKPDCPDSSDEENCREFGKVVFCNALQVLNSA